MTQAECFVPIRFDTSTLPVERQFEAFARALAGYSLTPRRPGPFAARARVWRVGALVISHGTIDPVRYERTAARIHQDSADHVVVNILYKGGYRLDRGEGAVRVRRGAISVVDLRQPWRADYDRREIVAISIPRGLILPRLMGSDPHGFVGDDGLVPLLHATTRAVLSALPVTPVGEADAMQAMLIDLIAHALTAGLRDPRHARPGTPLALRVEAYVDARLAMPLDVAAIAEAMKVSRSALYRALADVGGVHQLVRRRRLRRARAMLADPASNHSVAGIAAAVGFAEPAHFQRAFKREYGVPPGAYRDSLKPGETRAASLPDAPDRYRAWTRELP